MSSRLPRFKRVLNTQALSLTPLDEHLLIHVHQHRFLRSSHLAGLVGGSAQAVLRRLQLLFHHGYLERPRVQIEYFGKGGSSPIAYGLGNKGAMHLKAKLGISFLHLRLSEKNQSVGTIFLKHALLISDVMVACELAARRRPRVSIIPFESMRFAKADTSKKSSRWNVLSDSKVRIGLIPDRIFVIEQRTNDSRVNRMLFFLEADRGTMPVIRKNLSQTSIYRKLLAYEATSKSGLHRSLFGIHRFRVLFVTRSPARAASLVEACSKLKSCQGLFLFSDEATLKGCPDIFSLPCQSGKAGETSTILP